MADPEPDHERTVLLVEDDVAIARMYKLQLELDGYLVLTAADGETGLSIAERCEPDLIVLDMPWRVVVRRSRTRLGDAVSSSFGIEPNVRRLGLGRP